MKILIGTTNTSKVERFEKLLGGCDIEFCTLGDLGIHTEPEETGKIPEENAVIKARYYGSFCDLVICNDSGLYFDDLPLDDFRQPGLHIREPQGSRRLNDEEMIEYYSGLVHSLGGKVTAYYLDGIAVNNRGFISSYMENSERKKGSAFYMIDTPSEKRHVGWPLDSLSLNRTDLTYFTECGCAHPVILRGKFLTRSIFRELNAYYDSFAGRDDLYNASASLSYFSILQ